jgi:hypothetical protein
LLLNQSPDRWLDAGQAPIAAFLGQSLGLLGAIAALAAIAAQLTTDRRSVHTEEASDLALSASVLHQGINLVSLFLGKLCVAHQRSFDCRGLGGLYYRSLPLFQTVNVALVS